MTTKKRTHVIAPPCPHCGAKLKRYGYHTKTKREYLRCDNADCALAGTTTRFSRETGTTVLVQQTAREFLSRDEKHAKQRRYRERLRAKRLASQPATPVRMPKPARPTTPKQLKPQVEKPMTPALQTAHQKAIPVRPAPLPVMPSPEAIERKRRRDLEEQIEARRLAGQDLY